MCALDRAMFSKDLSKSDGLCTVCKPCKVIYRKAYYKAHADEARAYSSAWYRSNTELHMISQKQWVLKNKERILSNRRQAHKRRYASDPLYRMQHVMRSQLKLMFADIGKQKNVSTFVALGYCPAKLKMRLETNFKAGMSWDNYGDWEIDHKIPISVMLNRGETRAHIVNALSNLQPMWKHDNRKKGNRWIG